MGAESESSHQEPRQLGRYAMYGQIGSGGMATVHFGRLLGPSGFARSVAIKRLHEHFASDQDFADMLIDEAHTASRIAHTNVVPTLDVIAEQGELWLVMDYVSGESLARVLDEARGEPLPVPIAAALITGVLHGLHAAHETRGETGEQLGIVHRDVSPDNILVGVDGVPRLADFGVAKARGRVRTTPAGQVKGKLAYMPAEQLCGREVDRRADVYGAGAVLWETLCGRMLFDGASEGELVHRVLHQEVAAPSELNPAVPPELDAIVLRALSRDPDRRFATAREMASAIEAALRVASQSEIADWLQNMAGHRIAQRAAQLRSMLEAAGSVDGPATRVTPQGTQRAHSRTRPARAPATTPRPEAGRAGSRWPWVGVALLVLLSLAGGSWFLSAARRPPPLIEAAPAPLPVLPAAPPDPPRLDPPRLDPPSLEPPKSAEVAPAPAKERTRRRSARTAPRVALDCSPPYYLDAEGIRHVKPECL